MPETPHFMGHTPVKHYETPMTDEQRAQKIVREVFLYDLKGEIGKMARIGVPLSDRQDIARRLVKEFRQMREGAK